MQYKSVITSAFLASSALAAYHPTEPWSTLTPSEPAPTGAALNFEKKFGIAVILMSKSDPRISKREVKQIGDGQVQHHPGSPKSKPPVEGVIQIGDGQIQHHPGPKPGPNPGSKSKARPRPIAEGVIQIGDGQIQQLIPTRCVTECQPVAEEDVTSTSTIRRTTTLPAGNSNGQPHPTGVPGNGAPGATGVPGNGAPGATGVPGNGAPGAPGATGVPGNGAPGATGVPGNGPPGRAPGSGVYQIGDGQVQDSYDGVEESLFDQSTGTYTKVEYVCKRSNSLILSLKDSLLVDVNGRIGSIVANRQFQFDGPPPQAGTIFAGGWSVTKEGYLAMGGNDQFFRCLSGTFYNLYDQTVGGQCEKVMLEVVDLVNCSN